MTDVNVESSVTEGVTPEAGAPAAPADTVLTSTNSDAAPAASEADTGGGSPGDEAGSGSQTPPDTYADFAMPEGVEVDSALLSEATPLFKELGLTQEQAQKLVDFQAKQVQAGSANQVEAYNQLMNDWQDQARNDKEYGGDKFDENISVAQSALEKFGTPELKQMMEEYGIGNHPEVIRFMVKVGKLTSEDVPGGSTAALSTPKDRVSLLYPNDRNG